MSDQLFRAKPVVIEAKQWDGTSDEAELLVVWVRNNGGNALLIDHPGNEHLNTVSIWTLEGTMTADKGDWIIHGTKGEFYPCKPDVFATKYEPITPPTPDPVTPASVPRPEDLPKLTSRERHKGTGDVLTDLAHARNMTNTSEPGFGEVVCSGRELDFVNRAIRVAIGEIRELRNRIQVRAKGGA